MARCYAGDAWATLKVVGKDGGGHHYVKVEAAATREPVLTMFIRAGNEVTANVPAGRYNVKVASGLTWYGPKHLFGNSSDCQLLGEPFTFSVTESLTGREWTEWVVELTPQVLGNLKAQQIQIEDF